MAVRRSGRPLAYVARQSPKELGEHAAIVLGAAFLFAKHPLAPGGVELGELYVQLLAAGADTGVPIDAHGVLLSACKTPDFCKPPSLTATINLAAGVC